MKRALKPAASLHGAGLHCADGNARWVERGGRWNSSRHGHFYKWPLFGSSRGHNDSRRIGRPLPSSNEAA